MCHFKCCVWCGVCVHADARPVLMVFCLLAHFNIESMTEMWWVNRVNLNKCHVLTFSETCKLTDRQGPIRDAMPIEFNLASTDSDTRLHHGGPVGMRAELSEAHSRGPRMAIGSICQSGKQAVIIKWPIDCINSHPVLSGAVVSSSDRVAGVAACLLASCFPSSLTSGPVRAK